MKKLTILMCAVALLFTLASCNQTKKTTSAAKAPAADMAVAPAQSVPAAAPAPAPAAVAVPMVNKDTGTPVMQLDYDDMDYGTIGQGDEPLRVFTFTNTGDAPLQITNAKGSCGCTVPTYPKEPINPGEKAKIEVRYDTNRIGPFQKTVTLTTNEPEAVSTHILKIHGTVNAKPADPAAPAGNN